MFKEKYLANIDQILLNVIKKTSGKIENQDMIPYSDELVENGTFKKIALDIFRVEHDPYGGLWAVENYQGKPYLVRTHTPQVEQTNRGNWTAVSDYDKSNITLSYKDVPIARFSSKVYGFTPQDVITFKEALLENLEDQSFVKDILLEEPESKRMALISKFPEFKKIIGV